MRLPCSSTLSAGGVVRTSCTLALAFLLATGCPADDDGFTGPSDLVTDASDLSTDVVTEPVADSGRDSVGDPPVTGDCDPSTESGLMGCVDSDSYWTDLVFIASERTPGSDHWQAVQDLCATRFSELGYAVERHDYGSGINVIGTLPGGTSSAERVVVSAHYDHIASCDGADDNASGVAGVLELARVLALADFERTLVVACWDEEEFGLIGSTAYADRADESGDDIVVSIVFDMIGYASDEPNSQEAPDGIGLLFPDMVQELEANESRGDFLAVLSGSDASTPAHAVATYGDQVDLPVAVFELDLSLLNNPLLSDFLRSDHAPFWANGYPAILVSDTAELRNPNYHCYEGEDSVDTIDREFAIRSVRAIVGTVAQALHRTVD